MDNNSLKHFYDALIAARAIQSFIAGKTFDDYLDDDLLSAGVERKFEIIGEAFKRIRKESPNDLKAITNNRGIIDFRNVVAHAYDHLEDALVWGLANNQIHQLISELEAIKDIEPNGH